MTSLAALMARRLCHDFAGPAGAIGTAVEMLGDAGDPELVALTTDSSAALSAALELYRFVLTPSTEPVGGGRARSLVAAWLATRGDLKLEWEQDGDNWPPGFASLTAGLAMVVAEVAPRNGTVRVENGAVSASGTSLPPEVAAALVGEPAANTRAALAAVLADQAASAGVRITVDTAPELRLTASYLSKRAPR